MYNESFLENAQVDLFNLAVARETSRYSYSQFEATAANYRYVTLAEANNFDILQQSYAKKQDLDKQVIQKSKGFVDALPDGLKLAVKALGKPYYIGATAAKWYFLVATQKPKDGQDAIIVAEPEYTYDVEAREPVR